MPATLQKNKTTYEYLRYNFTPDEIRDLGADLAKNVSDAEELKLRKKEVVKELDSQISGYESKIGGVSRKILEGYEYRDVECSVYFHTPENGMKTIRRLDTFEVVKVLAMTQGEMQEELPLLSEDDTVPE